MNDKTLLTIKELCDYTGWSDTKVREILHRPDSTFALRLGSKWFIHKELFDEWLSKAAKLRISI